MPKLTFAFRRARFTLITTMTDSQHYICERTLPKFSETHQHIIMLRAVGLSQQSHKDKVWHLSNLPRHVSVCLTKGPKCATEIATLRSGLFLVFGSVLGGICYKFSLWRLGKSLWWQCGLSCSSFPEINVILKLGRIQQTTAPTKKKWHIHFKENSKYHDLLLVTWSPSRLYTWFTCF